MQNNRGNPEKIIAAFQSYEILKNLKLINNNGSGVETFIPQKLRRKLL